MRHARMIAVVTLLAACEQRTDDVKPNADGVKPAPSKASEGKATKPAVDVLALAKKTFGAPPKVADSERNPVTDAKVELGRMLYYDTRLSKNHDVSCNTCHDLDQYGIDVRGDRKTSEGHKGQKGDRNSPTVYNAALHFKQFWDGRAEDVEAQAKGPVLNPIEMAMPSEAAVLKVLESIPGYEDKFAAAFPDDASPITYDNMAKAIAAFERKLINADSPFDEFLAGKVAALNDDAKQGMQTFIEAGCIACHSGPTLGGTMFQKLGLTKPYETKDEGRFKITEDEADKHVFKVPSLRNIAKTGPYLHDGSVSELPEMVQIMATHQTGGGALPDDKVKLVVAFLESLTGKIPKDYVAKPDLPESGPKTPKPDPS